LVEGALRAGDGAIDVIYRGTAYLLPRLVCGGVDDFDRVADAAQRLPIDKWPVHIASW
jgi:hypothetical protein